MWLTRLSVERPIFIVAVVAAAVLFGWYGYHRMPAELNPRVIVPVVNVTVVYPGASPDEVQDRVTKPLEDAVSSAPRVRDVDSTSLENVSNVTIRFQDGADAGASAAEVRTRVEAARINLPTEAQQPVVARVDTDTQPVMVLGIHLAQPRPG